MIDSRPPPDDDLGGDMFDGDVDEFGSMEFTPLEALESHLETGRPLSERDRNRLIDAGLATKADFAKKDGGFEYIGTRWSV